MDKLLGALIPAIQSKPNFMDALLNRDPKGILAAKKIINKMASFEGDKEGKTGTFIDDFATGDLMRFKLIDSSITLTTSDGKNIDIDMSDTHGVKVDKKYVNDLNKPIVRLKGDKNGKKYYVKIYKKIDNEYRVVIYLGDEGEESGQKRTIKLKHI
jgi:hypothetical protein